MANTVKVLGASLVALTMAVSATAFAATDEAPANGTPQTENGGGKSYLPPWMQKKDGETASQTSAAGPSAASGAGAAAAARPAANGVSQQADAQRRRARMQPPSRQTRNSNVPFFRGVASLFGGLAR
jgi:hypothetical protein